MKKINEIRIITREEAIILFEALHPYLMKKVGEEKTDSIPPGPHDPTELMKINQLYQDLKYFLQQGEDTE